MTTRYVYVCDGCGTEYSGSDELKARLYLQDSLTSTAQGSSWGGGFCSQECVRSWVLRTTDLDEVIETRKARKNRLTQLLRML